MNTVVPFRVLIVKMSSLGDVIHTLPSLSDAAKAHPNIQFDWVIEEGFAEIPAWHPRVDRVIPVALRRWKKDWKKAWSSGEFPRFLKALRARRYDLIIDPQGLLKSGLITLLAKGPVYGYDRASLKEGIARLFYRRGFSVARDLHAVLRMRLLFSKALKYEFEPEAYEYGLLIPESTFAPQGKYVLLMHGTTWVTKHWPEAYWIDLANKVREAAFPVYLSFGNEVEKARAERIAKASGAQVLPKLKLSEMARVIQGAYAIVALDSGLTHLAAALSVPTISLFGPTDPKLTAPFGRNQIPLKAKFPCAPCFSRECTYQGPHPVEPPCFQTINPEVVWAKLEGMLERSL